LPKESIQPILGLFDLFNMAVVTDWSQIGKYLCPKEGAADAVARLRLDKQLPFNYFQSQKENA